MYELIQLSEHDYYVESPAKIGLVLIGAGEVIAIDSGSDKDAGKKVLRAIESNGWHLKAIYNTHSHADHIGGNKLLQERTGCRVFARGMECAFTNFPLLEPMNLCGGYPMRELQHKFLLAQGSRAEPLTPEVLPEGIELLELPGHSFDMVGFRTADGNVFLADCVSSEETLEKYGIGYLWEIGAHLETLERVKGMTVKQFIPAHAAVTEDIAPLAQRNIDAVLDTAERIAALCGEGTTFEELLRALFLSYDLTMTAQQYALIGSTLRSYLAWLQGQGRVAVRIEDARMLWQRTKE